MKNIILASSSSVHGSGYLEYLEPELKVLFAGVTEILFIPYARPSGISYEEYTEIAAKGFSKLGIDVIGIHEFTNPKSAIENAKAIFVGGGNTFVLVATLYELEIMQDLKSCIESGIPYLGTSAGSNICGMTMQTTNDMPIKMPKSFKTLGVFPFNINAHFIEADKSSTHKGETRETRIKEYHVFNETAVIGLKEGSWLRVLGNTITLDGELEAVLFKKNKSPKRVSPKTNLNH
ncbi:dipeptidase PepE [Flavicella sp.]|uniref:dipeptidase PepE n=1 Tax=Flavicella sp. TaxID=2957742 RepID=UPI0026191EAB|nr:dipeptidase PepE [Flavicella sp.]MDG1803839.1 dipeptidase PepE [Flavicella sp.]